ncbi:phage terminase small subunit P27 family [Ancylobacter polymorphus]|uniref:Phage terminase small subunit P27 family n=1 Tax=Ancylobacter polymorphus TaxID=223390 RepID=A0A9E6ZR71_9HYPH|nr:phage terminase small subunit P27 family [Ancylobacter polymorphus]UOK70271.1 phage terminase small subunit P27 family [Ancylobacter polymorphus]UOK70445.1 phage terminase small subunit P27 family [Ancylobacter polymorphus]
MARGRKAEITAVDGALDKAPAAPKWLPAYAKAEWKRLVPILVNDRKLAVHELQSVESYCISVARIREAEEIIAREGLVIMGTRGPQRHPATAILKEHQEAARRLLIELGGTPASRGKNKGGAVGNDPADDLGDI